MCSNRPASNTSRRAQWLRLFLKTSHLRISLLLTSPLTLSLSLPGQSPRILCISNVRRWWWACESLCHGGRVIAFTKPASPALPVGYSARPFCCCIVIIDLGLHETKRSRLARRDDGVRALQAMRGWRSPRFGSCRVNRSSIIGARSDAINWLARVTGGARQDG